MAWGIFVKSRDHNSQVRVSTLETLYYLLDDLSTHHPYHSKEFQLDKLKISKRFEAEGVEFLTCTLPTLGKALVKALEQEFLLIPFGFKKKKGTQLPLLFNGLWLQVFDGNGKLKSLPDSSALVDLFQILFFFYKLDLPTDPRKERKVIQNFIEVEKELEDLYIKVDDPVLFLAQDLIKDHFDNFNYRDISPNHGPGAVATGEKNADKWVFKRKYSNIHKVYPYYEYFVPSRNGLLDSVSWYKNLEQLESGCARVTLVPKDSRGPRLISMEPLEYQFIQQGLARALVEHFETKSFITRGRVNFTDQTVNRNLALYNSCSRAYATLDMKEASDRVSVQLVERLFSKTKGLLNCLLATRTTHTELPDGTILPLKKFAPMGSALCFPVEAFIFFVLSEAIRKRMRIGGTTYVYGDDIIVPRELVPHLLKLFPFYGLKFNEDKCFTSGYFRESCGLDAYKGNLCTPVRMRTVLPQSKKEASSLVSAVELSNYLYSRGYWKSARYVEESVKRFLPVDVLKSPKVYFGGLAFASFTIKGVITGDRTSVRFNKNVQSYESRCFIGYQPVKQRKRIHDYGRLFMNLVNQKQETDAVPHAAAIKLRWYPIYS